MANGFNMELRGQQEWSWLLTIDLFLGGLGGGLFLLFQIFHLPPVMALLSLGLVALGGVVLLSELGRPWRAWRAIFRLRTSWISRGVLFVSLFLAAGSIYIAAALRVFSWFPPASDHPGIRMLGVIAGLCALLITVYPGFVLSASRGIPFWDSLLLPVLFFTHSAMGASGVVLLVSRFRSLERGLHPIEVLAAALIIVNLIAISIYVWAMNRASVAAQEAVKLLQRGPLGWTFGVGVILVGMVVPLAVVLWMPSAEVLAGGSILIGALLFRYSVLKAGVYAPLALVGLDMSKLCRADADLVGEYAGSTAGRP
jgi:sulfite dehydrogenase (quinone) subunit SoeC